MYFQTSKIEFVIARVTAERDRPMIKANLCLTSELSDMGYYYLSGDSKSGFGLVENVGGGFDLVSVFSSVKGRGDELLSEAIKHGATTLDCFDGYLANWYRERGWATYAREQNWNGSSFPDVVFFAHSSAVKG